MCATTADGRMALELGMRLRRCGPTSEPCGVRLTLDSKSMGNPSQADAATILSSIFAMPRDFPTGSDLIRQILCSSPPSQHYKNPCKRGKLICPAIRFNIKRTNRYLPLRQRKRLNAESRAAIWNTPFYESLL